MHQSEGFQLIIVTNRPSIISEGQVADEFHHFTIILFPPSLPLAESSTESEALLCGSCFLADWRVGLVHTRWHSGGEPGIMVGSSALQRLTKINPDGVRAALQMVPEPSGSAKTL